jgi:hypothetical protein
MRVKMAKRQYKPIPVTLHGMQNRAVSDSSRGADSLAAGHIP